MAVTKTDFINYVRCRRYVALENLKEDKLTSHMTLEEYLKNEENSKYEEILGTMFEVSDEEEVDLTEKVDKQLEAMMDYYKEVEMLAALQVEKVFKGKSIFSEKTYNQESFDCIINGIRYLCYVDIYNENDNEINIIEVKATTSKKYKDMFYIDNKEHYPMFEKLNNIYYLVNKPENDKNYLQKLSNLMNKNRGEGKYFYDLAVQRYIIEHYFNENKTNKKINYYLAVLNNEYVYDGKVVDGKRVYDTVDGQDIIDIIDCNSITKLMMDIIDKDRENIERYIIEQDSSKCRLSINCALKSRGECKYIKTCFKDVPEYNTSYNYRRFRSFDDNGVKYDKYELLNNGYLSLGDIPKEWLKSKNHIIQRECFDNNEIYVDKEKITAGLNSLEYPIYHLDFETFPCPIPRYKGEVPYIQSPFEFSLHIEHAPGVCDKDKDNYVFLASTTEDEREELVKELVNRIDLTRGGCMLAQNVSFEKGRIKELAKIYPQYKDKLMKIYDSGRDLLEIIENKKDLYESLGFNEERSSTFNYYNNLLSGSFSIKKTLPLFSDLTYKNLEVKNGTEAIVAYANYDKMDKETLRQAQKNLVIYCKQDTWAMVEILKGLRNLVK